MQSIVRTDEGSGPAVVYVPGIDGSGAMLLGAQARLARVFRLVCLAYRTGEREEARYERLAASLVACLDERRIDRAVLLAESFGGGVALHAALAHRERVAGLALVNTFAHFAPRLRLAFSRLTAPLLPGWAFALGRRLCGTAALFGARREPQAVAAFRGRAFGRFDRGYRQRLAMLAGLDLRARLAEIAAPALVVIGERDRVVPPAHGRALAAGLPNARLEVVPGGGHLLLPLAALPWEAWVGQIGR
jgi:3-oxoadipate enol-lactonase